MRKIPYMGPEFKPRTFTSHYESNLGALWFNYENLGHSRFQSCFSGFFQTTYTMRLGNCWEYSNAENANLAAALTNYVNFVNHYDAC